MIKVEGIKELMEQMAELGDVLTQQKTLRSVAKKAFKPVLDAAKAKVPVDTGVLRDSIILTSPTKQNKNAQHAVAVVGLTVRRTKTKDIRKDASWRWHFVERGTRSMPARPFMRPALDGNAQLVVDNLRTLLKAEIDRAIRKKGRRK